MDVEVRGPGVTRVDGFAVGSALGSWQETGSIHIYMYPFRSLSLFYDYQNSIMRTVH